MKRFVIVLLAIAMATFAFAGGSCFKMYLNGGVNEPGMVGSAAFAYNHNPVETGFDVKLGIRKHLKDYFEMPEALPLEVQLGLGFQMNAEKATAAEDLMAFTFNADLLYPIDQVVCIPVIDISPFIGLSYDLHLYRDWDGTSAQWNAHLIGVQAGVMFDLDLTERLAVELVLANPFNFDVSGNIPQVVTSQAYANVGLSYVFGGNK